MFPVRGTPVPFETPAALTRTCVHSSSAKLLVATLGRPGRVSEQRCAYPISVDARRLPAAGYGAA
eukprot:12230120-Prorocentrum_lima.AAC.1